jgi:UDP-glucose 4-epimerase
VKFLITGSRGFIGGSVGRYAAQLGHAVLGTGRSRTLGKDWPAEYVQTDMSPSNFAAIVKGFAPDVLLHAAGSASVSSSILDPVGDLRAAALTCANVLEGVRVSGFRPLVIIPSSAAVFGNPAVLPIGEDAKVKPISPYGFHKAVCELLAREYAECFGLEIVVCRFFSVFGSAQRRLLIWELYHQLIGSESTAWLAGTGSESRDFLHVDDLAAAVLGLVQNRVGVAPCSCMIVNVGSGIETGVLAIAEQLRDIVAPEKEIRCRGNVRPNDPLRWCADISRLRSLLPSWQPRSLSKGLALCVTAWQQENQSTRHGS